MSTLIYVLLSLTVVAIALTLFAVYKRRRFIRFLLIPILTAFYRARVVGLENFPKDGGVVVVSNHVSWIDGILLLWMLPRNIRFLVDGGNFKSRVLDWFAGAFDTIMMSSSPKSIGRALITARETLHNGGAVGIFPEGTLTYKCKNAKQKRFKN